jgi:hypothetical protein
LNISTLQRLRRSKKLPNSNKPMKAKNCILSTALITVLTTSASLTAATLVNIDFNAPGGSNGSNNPPIGSYDGSTAPVLGNNGDTWNGVDFNTTTSPKNLTTAALVTADSLASTIVVTIEGFQNSYDAYTTPTIGATFRSLMGDYLYLEGQQATAAVIRVTGLPASQLISLVFLAANAANQGSTFSIGANSLSTSDTAGIGTSLIAGDEYVQFSETSSATGEIEIKWTLKAGNQYSALNGMQIDIAAIPEPSAALLGGLGVLGLLRRRRA